MPIAPALPSIGIATDILSDRLRRQRHDVTDSFNPLVPQSILDWRACLCFN